MKAIEDPKHGFGCDEQGRRTAGQRGVRETLRRPLEKVSAPGREAPHSGVPDAVMAERRAPAGRMVAERRFGLDQRDPSMPGQCRARGKAGHAAADDHIIRSEEHTSELQSLMRTSYAVSC